MHRVAIWTDDDPGYNAPTTAPTPAATTLATTVMTTAITPAPKAQAEATILNQTNVSITIKNFAFSQAFIIVSKGTTVTWTNQDTTQHQIINDPTMIPGMGNIFKSGLLGIGQSYSFTFTSTGMFPSHCNIHPSMEGKITVK